MKTSTLMRALAGFILYILLNVGLLFLTAGTFDWPMAWIYTALILLSIFISRYVAWRRNPDVLRERARFMERQHGEEWDRRLVVLLTLAGLATLLTAGWQHRAGVSTFSSTAQWTAALFVTFGYAISVWAMIVNPFFSAVVRLQKDRGQEVVSAGPYRWLRHPSYSGAILGGLALPIMLDSPLAFIPSLLYIIILILRTAREDQLLITSLPGYAEYTDNTGYRLIPFIW